MVRFNLRSKYLSKFSKQTQRKEPYMTRVESLLSARLFLRPQVCGERIYFLSNLSGHISLYAMNHGGSVPEPLLPPDLALQNPHLIDGGSFFVFPSLGKILVMIDRDGDEVYQPMLIPLDGGYPQPAFENFFQDYRVHLGGADIETGDVYLFAESRAEPLNLTYRGNLASGALTLLGKSMFGFFPASHTPDHRKVALIEGYTVGDNVVYLQEKGKDQFTLLYGTPMEQRTPGQQVPLNGIGSVEFTDSQSGVVMQSNLFEDTGDLCYLSLSEPGQVRRIQVSGALHQGVGELELVQHLRNARYPDRYLVQYNIDGCSWVYEASFDETRLEMKLERALVGRGELSAGVLEAISYDKAGDRYALAFSTATSPTQIYTIEGAQRERLIRHTNERILGLPAAWLSSGEDYSFTSFDGTRVSARLYLPAAELGFTGPRPVVYYIHGGPQGQERPDFAWFSMPLIQFLTLNGFAVFVPNVRGSTGYGLSYTKQVDKDWGGQDRLDHVHAMTQVLPKDSRLDVSRAGVVGRSYGGYMTLTLSGRHPELWKGAVDMFGPYDLVTFSQRIPETWKPYFHMVLGNPEVPEERAFLEERSPRAYLHNLSCPMLVIQGKNDPRVVEAESLDLVQKLRGEGKQVEYLMFENEGHDVLKFENRVTCYNAITDFFKRTLKP